MTKRTGASLLSFLDDIKSETFLGESKVRRVEHYVEPIGNDKLPMYCSLREVDQVVLRYMDDYINKGKSFVLLKQHTWQLRVPDFSIDKGSDHRRNGLVAEDVLIKVFLENKIYIKLGGGVLHQVYIKQNPIIKKSEDGLSRELIDCSAKVLDFEFGLEIKFIGNSDKFRNSFVAVQGSPMQHAAILEYPGLYCLIGESFGKYNVRLYGAAHRGMWTRNEFEYHRGK